MSGVIRYFKKAAKLLGQEREEDDKKRKNDKKEQGAYSLSWYFEDCLEQDVNPELDTYSELLDAYLNLNQGPTLQPATLDELEMKKEDKLLDNGFPLRKHKLNEYQRMAVHMALHNPVTIIVGPPGTGKTETIIRILALAREKGESVAFVSSNREAMDNVVSKVKEFANTDLNTDLSTDLSTDLNTDLGRKLAHRFVRLGRANERKDVCQYADGTTFSPAFKSGEKASGPAKGQKGWEQNISLTRFCKEGSEGPVCISSTVHSLKKCFVDGDKKKYDLVVMDEASQSDVLLGIICMSSARRIVVVGDDNQLPPILSRDAASALKESKRVPPALSLWNEEGKEQSFLGSMIRVFCPNEDIAPDEEILSNSFGPRVGITLRKHYRCHPNIIGFCDKYFYGGLLDVCTEIKSDASKTPLSLRWYEGDYREKDVRFDDDKTKDPNKKQLWRPSVVNCRQIAVLACEEMPHIRDLYKREKSICVVTPFWAQSKMIKELLEHELGARPVALPNDADEQDACDDDDAQDVRSAGEDAFVVVQKDGEPTSTVHSSQGKEYDCVYFLPVEDGRWEWPWSQERRLVNVAVSRAREELHVIVSSKLMDEGLQKKLGADLIKPMMDGSVCDGKNDDGLFVSKLTNYMYYGPEERKDITPPFGEIQRSSLVSLFDKAPLVQGTLKQLQEKMGEDANLPSAPELLVGKALGEMRFPDYPELRVATNVDLEFIHACGTNEPFPDDGMADHDYHFDFVVFYSEPKSKTKRIVAVIEVDGAQHRYARYNGADEGRSAKNAYNDWHKETLVRKHGGTCAWLGAPGGHQLVQQNEDKKSRGRFPVLPAGMQRNVQKNRLEGWVASPSELPAQSTFVFIRIPDDGSTYLETDALQNGASLQGGLPPTIDAYIRAQAAIKVDDESGLTLDNKAVLRDKDHMLFSMQSVELGKKDGIRACCKAWKEAELTSISPQAANTRLLELGLLEELPNKGKVPSSAGRAVGITEFGGAESGGKSFVIATYGAFVSELVRMVLMV